MDSLQPLIYESLQLLLIGMGTVFVILIMLIFLITMVSKIFASSEDRELHDGVHQPVRVATGKVISNHDELVVVISAAITAYRKRRSGN